MSAMTAQATPTPEQEQRAKWDLLLLRIDLRIAETEKLQEEARKYAAETRRLSREDRYFPWLQIVSSSAIAALIGALG
jgi:hypothetical protein